MEGCDIENLVTVKTFAKMLDVTPSYIHILERHHEVEFTVVDGVLFVDKVAHKPIINKRGRKKVIERINKILKELKDAK